MNTVMHKTLDSITTYQGEGPPGRRGVTRARDHRGRRQGRHTCAGRNLVGFLTLRPQFKKYQLS